MRELTPKEQEVIRQFELLRPSHGQIAHQNILNPDSGWKEIIEQMSMDEIKVVQDHEANMNILEG